MTDKKKYIPPILIALIVAILPNMSRLPAWIILWCASMWGYIFFSLKYTWPWPGRAVRLALSFAGFLGLLATYRVRLGPDAYLGLLAIMSALKPFEIFTHRDRMITIFLAYFMVIASLFQSDSLFITIYMFASVCITTAALVRINDPYGKFKANLRLSAIIMAQALPLMVLLFFLFPRIQGSLFGLSRAFVAESGFSDELSLSSVSTLAVNTDVAFRAEFNGAVPPPQRLYWRGIVFENFNGKKWDRSHNMVMLGRPPAGENSVNYTVILEPSGSRWLFALDLPGQIPPRAILDSNYTLHMPSQITQTLSYDMTSYSRYQESVSNRWMIQDDLKLPAYGNPRSLALAHQLTAGANSTAEKVQRVLSYFKNSGFVYSLKPPALGENLIDDFLFESKQGYCQHYAAVFAFLMRAADVPARIVGGYLGGEVNPFFKNYLIVRQSDAHVWVEVWEPENGWVRVDPTATVAPDRITGRLEGLLPGGLLLKYMGPFSKYIQAMGFGWDAVTTAWSAFFYGYSYYEQKALLEKFGIKWGSFIGSLLGLAAVMLILFFTFAIAAGYSVFGFKKAARQKDAVKKYYLKFCGKLARVGIAKPPNQGAIHFAQHIADYRPDLKQSVDDITALYVQLRYRPDTDDHALKQFIAVVRAFKPRSIF